MKINSCLVFPFLVLLVSYALAIQTSQQETANHEAKEAKNKVEPAYGGGGGNSGGGNWGGGGGGNWGGGGGGGGCKHGCCYKGNYGCNRCCASPEEAKAYAEKQGGTEKVKDKVEPAYGGGGGNWGGGGGGSGGGGGRGGGGGSWGGGGGGGGGCKHGCCYKGNYGCNRCCASLEEAKAYAEKQGTKGAKDKVEPAYGGGGGNWGGGGGGSGGGGGGSWGGGGGRGGCNHGCCYKGSYGCQRCCASAEEAKAYAEKQAQP